MKVLIVKTSSLGDIIHTFPVIEFLKACYPESHIDWVVEKPFADLLRFHPDIRTVIEVDTKKWRNSLLSPTTWKDIRKSKQEIEKEKYDIAFDFQGNTKSGLILSWVNTKRKVGFGKGVTPEWPNKLFTNEKFVPPKGNNIRDDYLYLVKESLQINEPYKQQSVAFSISDNEKNKVDSLLPPSRKVILVCPGSRWKNKQLPHETLKKSLADILVNDPEVWFLFSWGNDFELKSCQELQREFREQSTVLPKTSLSTLQYLMSKVDLVIAMDSLPLHLAGTTPTKTIGVFGPSSSLKYSPLGEKHQSVQGKCPYGKSFEKRCPILRSCKTGACIKNISSEQITKKILN